MPDFKEQRLQMVEAQIRDRGVSDARVLAAIGDVPRESFIPGANRARAYADAPVSIGEGQTISQPYIVAFMVEALALQGDEKVLEIGSGSGYAAAILSRMVHEVFAVERIEVLAKTSAQTLHRLGVYNVRVRFDDGTRGWPEEAPFDAILVSAGGPKLPGTLKAQLAVGGRMIMPLGRTALVQNLTRITRVSKEEYTREDIAAVRFVPLIGEEGWREP